VIKYKAMADETVDDFKDMFIIMRFAFENTVKMIIKLLTSNIRSWKILHRAKDLKLMILN
jgi:hypothetical protein